MSGTTRIRPADCDPGALVSDEDLGGSFSSGPQNACVTAGHAAASASASARLSATAAASAAACVAVSPGSASEKAHEAAKAAGAVAEAAAAAEAKAEAATVAWLARAAAEDAAGPTPIIQPPPRPPGPQKLKDVRVLPKDVRELPTSKTSVYRQGKLVSDGARPNGVGVESEEGAAVEEAARVAGTHAAAAEAAEAAKAERLSRARRQLSAEKARRETASAASAVTAAETDAAAAARLRDEAKESLRELQAMEAEATKAEKLARARGGSQKLAAGKAQRKSELSGAIARLEAAAAAAGGAAAAAEAKAVAARAAKVARAAAEETASAESAVAASAAAEAVKAKAKAKVEAAKAAEAARLADANFAYARKPAEDLTRDGQLSNLVSWLEGVMEDEGSEEPSAALERKGLPPNPAVPPPKSSPKGVVDDTYLARLASGSSKKLLPSGSVKELPKGLPPGMPPSSKKSDSPSSKRPEQRAEEPPRGSSPHYKRAGPAPVSAPPLNPRAAALLRARQHKAGSSPALSTQVKSGPTSPEKPVSPVANPAAMARARSGNTNIAGGALPGKSAFPVPAVKKSDSWSQRVEEARLREQRRGSAAAAKSAAAAASPPAAPHGTRAGSGTSSMGRAKAAAGVQEVQRRAQEVQSWLDQPPDAAPAALQRRCSGSSVGSAGSGGIRDSDADGGTIYLVTPGARDTTSPNSREIKIDLTEPKPAPRRAAAAPSAACDYGSAARYARQVASGCDKSARSSFNSKKNLYAARRAQEDSPQAERPRYGASMERDDQFELGI